MTRFQILAALALMSCAHPVAVAPAPQPACGSVTVRFVPPTAAKSDGFVCTYDTEAVPPARGLMCMTVEDFLLISDLRGAGLGGKKP